MDLVSTLRTFLRVAETGSFSAAASDLNITQPAVSRQISALEARLKTRLLHRSTSASALTAEGRQMIPMALRVIDAVEALVEPTSSKEGTATGKVRLSVPAPLGIYLGDCLPALVRAHPDLSIDIVFREEPSDLVEQGIDLEVRLGTVKDNGLMCRRIGWTTAFLVAAPSYLEARTPPESPDEIQRHACICYTRGGNNRSWSFSDAEKEFLVQIQSRLIVDNPVAVRRTVLSGAGLAVLSHILVSEDIQAGRLVSLMPAFPPTRLPINLVYPTRQNLPYRVRVVLDFLVESVRGDPFMALSPYCEATD